MVGTVPSLAMRVAAVQLTAGADLRANFDHGVEGVRAAAAAGARLVVLPEKWLALGDGPALWPAAQSIGGEIVRELQELARELQIDLVAGSLSELPGALAPHHDFLARAAGGPEHRLFNTSLLIHPDGTIAAEYRKVHLFDADVGGARYRESDAEQPGDQAVVAPLGTDPAIQLGMSICFDLRFPDYYGALAALGANVFVIPSAFTDVTTRAHWETLVRARAIEQGAFVIAANQVGEHPDGRRTGGQSLIVDPWGNVLAKASGAAPDLIITELDLMHVTEAREALPVRRLRRPDVYAVQPVGGHGPTA
jgi:predicted amidohydrolase